MFALWYVASQTQYTTPTPDLFLSQEELYSLWCRDQESDVISEWGEPLQQSSAVDVNQGSTVKLPILPYSVMRRPGQCEKAVVNKIESLY